MKRQILFLALVIIPACVETTFDEGEASVEAPSISLVPCEDRCGPPPLYDTPGDAGAPITDAGDAEAIQPDSPNVLATCGQGDYGKTCSLSEGSGVCNGLGTCCPVCHNDGDLCATPNIPSGACSGGLCCSAGGWCDMNFCLLGL